MASVRCVSSLQTSLQLTTLPPSPSSNARRSPWGSSSPTSAPTKTWTRTTPSLPLADKLASVCHDAGADGVQPVVGLWSFPVENDVAQSERTRHQRLSFNNTAAHNSDENTIELPSSMTFLKCRDMYRVWFSATLRTLSSTENLYHTQWGKAKVFIEALVAVAIQTNLVASAAALESMDSSALMTLFDAVFAAFLFAVALLSPVHFFPPLDCRSLWRLRFKGDAVTSGTPYGRNDHWASNCHYHNAKRIIRILVDMAESLILPPPACEAALEAMSEAALLDVFDIVFPVFVSQFDPSVLHECGPILKASDMVQSPAGAPPIDFVSTHLTPLVPWRRGVGKDAVPALPQWRWLQHDQAVVA
ncbi:Aste57867_5617 [Aphanomyces stellatus]|uniref:Aste57867_5617 protein n=1 Tax=Aphanomyces stellatus TaxID=120398 RepID=A0A485KEF5_9STRA|nr:hypothetical protein As57867_005604 [Aphanomyces stellatus]VFT82663.1 Aste57867_5617 [Aphanomyces stellatus]